MGSISGHHGPNDNYLSLWGMVCSSAAFKASVTIEDLILKVVHSQSLMQLVLFTFWILLYYPNQEVDSFLQAEVVDLYFNDIWLWMPLEENDPEWFCVHSLMRCWNAVVKGMHSLTLFLGDMHSCCEIASKNRWYFSPFFLVICRKCLSPNHALLCLFEY